MTKVAAIALVTSFFILTPLLARADIVARERELAQLTNLVRRKDIPQRHRLVHQSRRHSEDMLEENRLFHTPEESLSKRCVIIGEVVGFDGVLGIFRAFMRSRPHRKIILAPRWDVQGWGIAVGRGKLWTTGRFCDGSEEERWR